eukprot:scaffold7673_cov258-Pinguiococcus_pyrenoidosus.AAC.12
MRHSDRELLCEGGQDLAATEILRTGGFGDRVKLRYVNGRRPQLALYEATTQPQDSSTPDDVVSLGGWYAPLPKTRKRIEEGNPLDRDYALEAGQRWFTHSTRLLSFLFCFFGGTRKREQIISFLNLSLKDEE